MPRKKIIPELTAADRFDEQIVEAIWRTTIANRETLAREFEAGIISGLVASRRVRNTTVDAVLIASLVDADSRLVFRGETMRARRLIDLLKIVRELPQYTELKSYPQTSYSTVYNFDETVEKSPIPVDKTVENIVEKPYSPVEKLSTIYTKQPKSGDLSTGCGKLRKLPVLLSTELSTGSQHVDK